ncbi:sensor histidine kinase [Sphingomonas oleivorans]|uniref:Sensor histidine kinase n=1 Tax=Sphingomonas oleivorans TaxID=1735121 RepID=A0A2T5FWT9_9SPHN|nr:HAMP domain-containing histidine kinase [Sphingomonas oleivorans]PTQ10215.1 sensor histidine kinase [Sphingomonas oleivorans]
MRFDDMLATVIAQPLDEPAGRLRAWRQLVDLLAQGKAGAADDRLADRAYALARRLRAEIPVSIRAEAAASILGRRIPAALVAFFAEEVPVIAGPVIAAVGLDTEEWLAILPMLSSDAKACLAGREDLPAEVVVALGHAEPDATAEGGHSISDLLSRIDAFRARPAAPADAPEEIAPQEPIERFSFLTDADGLLVSIEGAPADGIVGETIAVVASDPDHGVDGHAAGAWRRRASFADARLSLAGEGPASGEWRISADPLFDAEDGRFLGYRGDARRPRADETPLRSEAVTGATGADRFERIVDDLRGPLDAIAGFSEIAGPERAETPGYRSAATEVIEHSLRLLAAVDEFDAAAAAAGAAERNRADASTLLTRLHESYLPLAEQRGVSFSFRIAAGLPPIIADPVAVERMFARLLAATVAIARRGERIVVRVGRDRRDGGLLAFSLSRPGALVGQDERALLGPGTGSEGDFPDAPFLALGFALRLVRNLATEADGRLDIDPDRFILCLPLRERVKQADEGQG